MGHFGIPGPGGSLGICAVCGESFAGEAIKDLMGMDSGIEGFSVGFVADTLYCHSPKCKETLQSAFSAGEDDPAKALNALPDGPLKKVLGEAIEAQEQP